MAKIQTNTPVTEQPATTTESTPVIPQEAYTYQADNNGNVMAGEATGVLPGTNLETQESLVAKQEVPEVKSQQAYLNPWGREGFTVEEALKNSDASIQQVMEDNIRWANDNGQQFDISPYLGIMSRGQDITKSTQQNEIDEKKAARQEKWERLGNFLSHLGNFVGAAAFGAPSQKLESGTELTTRQKKLRDETLNQRNAYNKNYLENFWKQREQDYKNNRLTQYQQSLDRQDAELYLKEKQFDAKMSLEQRKLEIMKDYREGLLSQGAARIAIQRLNAETARMNANTSRTRESRMAGGTTTSTTVTKNTATGKETVTTEKTTKPAGSTGTTKPQRTKVNY